MKEAEQVKAALARKGPKRPGRKVSRPVRSQAVA
jgi:hypothetical protein